MLNEAFRTGPQQIPGTGLPLAATVGSKGEMLIAATRARYYDLNYAKRLFHGTVGSVAGVSINGAASLAQTSAIVITNPVGSGVNAAIKRAVWQWVSGTMGACALYWAYCAAASTGGTIGAIVGGMLNASRAACAVYTGASSFSAQSVALRPAGLVISAYTALQTAAIPPPAQEIPEDDLFCPPGCTLGLVAIGAAGTTDRSMLSLSWSEDPI